MDDHHHEFLGGLLVGVALGAILAILYAPEKGTKTRKQLAKRSARWTDRASDAVGSAGEWVEKGRKRIGK